MREDYAISYNACLLVTSSYLQKLKKLRIDTKKISEEVQKIEDNLEIDIAKSYQNFSSAEAACFLHESLIEVYARATRGLEKINSYMLDEYNTYYKINAGYKNLVNILQTGVNKSNMPEVITKSKELLASIKSSETINYDSEKKIVESIYELIYKIIKLELIIGNSDSLLEYIKASSVDVSYISYLLRKELRKIPDDNKEIKERLDELEQNGIDDEFIVDKKLITLLVLANDENLIDKILEEYESKMKETKELSTHVEKAEKNNIELAEKITALKERKKKNFSKIVKKRIALTLNLLLVSAGIVASGATIKATMNTKHYKTVTTIYDSSTDETTEFEDYQEEITEKTITLKEYSPWEAPGYFRDEYKRTVYDYNLSKVDTSNFPSLKDYLTENNKEKLTCTSEEEVQKEQPKDIDYRNNKYVISKISQNKNDSKKVPAADWLRGLTLAATAAGIIVIDALVWKKLSKNNLKLLKEHKIEINSLLKDNSRTLLEKENELDSLRKRLKETQDDLTKIYLALPSTALETNAVKEKVLKLEKQNGNI